MKNLYLFCFKFLFCLKITNKLSLIKASNMPNEHTYDIEREIPQLEREREIERRLLPPAIMADMFFYLQFRREMAIFIFIYTHCDNC